MTPEDPLIPPDDDAVAVAARGALGRLAGSDGAPAPWHDVRARGRRVQVMRYATAAAACLLLVVAGVGTVSAVNGGGDHVDVAGTDPGGSTTTTSEPTSSTTTTTTTRPGVTTPGRGTNPVVIPSFPQAQAEDFEGTLQVESTTLVATEPMSVTLTLRNVTDHAVWVPGFQPIGAYLGFFSATGMTAGDELFAPGQTRTYASTITAAPSLIGSASLFTAVVRGIPMDFGTIVVDYLAGVPPVAVTVIPPGTEPGAPLDPSQGSWNIELSSDVDQAAPGESFVVHAEFTNTGTEPQQTYAYGALAVRCSSAGTAAADGNPMIPLTLAPGEHAALDLTVAADDAPGRSVICEAGVMFPTYDGSSVGDFSGATNVYPFAGITTTPLTIPITDGSATSTTGP